MTQALLPGFQPSEAELVDMAMAAPLEDKIDKAIAMLQHYERHALEMNPDGFWLAFSGGKDSGVIKELAKMAGVKFRPVYNVSTIDPPELIYFMREHHGDVKWNRQADCHMLTKMVNSGKGPPTRLARWCCEKYKEGGGDGMCKIIGVRAAESPKRKKMWKPFVSNRRMGTIVCPILYWTDEDIWDFHKLRLLPYCCLYDEGFKRLGCIGCPMAGKNRLKEFERWPAYEKMWKKAFERFWNNWHGKPNRYGNPYWFEDFGSWEGLWEWWLTREAKDNDDNDGCQMEFMFT